MQSAAMDPTQMDLFDLADRRLTWLDQRQSVLAQNVANVATPGYVARDLPSFAATLAANPSPAMARTNPGHLAGTRDSQLATVQPRPDARAPDGNTVSLDKQLTKIADSETAQELVTSIYKKYLDMFSLALGHSSS